jgi:capsular polysaccharide biosynthesis protein
LAVTACLAKPLLAIGHLVAPQRQPGRLCAVPESDHAKTLTRDTLDLWDLTRLLFRRWYFALPMLLASVATVFLTTQAVSPDYKAKGHLQVIPPPGASKPDDPTAPPRPRNPWLDLGCQVLGNAALLKVTDRPVLERLVNSGLTASVTITLSDRSPLLEIEAVGTSPAQATATVREVIRLLNEDIAAEQKPYGVYPEDTITTLTLNDGGDVEVVTSKVKRVLVVGAGLGMLVTAAGTIGLDGLLRLRNRRRLGFDARGLSSQTQNDANSGPTGPMPRWQADNGPAQDTVLLPVLSLPAASGPSLRSRPTRATVSAPGPGLQSAGSVGAESGRGADDPAGVQRGAVDSSSVTVEYKQQADVPQLAAEIPQAANNHHLDDALASGDEPLDATIVLPLSRADWPRRDRNSGH